MKVWILTCLFRRLRNLILSCATSDVLLENPGGSKHGFLIHLCFCVVATEYLETQFVQVHAHGTHPQASNFTRHSTLRQTRRKSVLQTSPQHLALISHAHAKQNDTFIILVDGRSQSSSHLLHNTFNRHQLRAPAAEEHLHTNSNQAESISSLLHHHPIQAKAIRRRFPAQATPKHIQTTKVVQHLIEKRAKRKQKQSGQSRKHKVS